ncbi:MAG: alkaline phosphatase family protein [Gemmatimonadota bacterium]|jgi:hypothetical protein|nr:alkaline phosphatase family protein [Gemmatimonadota bacterium]
MGGFLRAFRAGLIAAITGAAGYALLELAFFARRNHLLPWDPGHGVLGIVFFAMHLGVAVAACALGAALGARISRDGAGVLSSALPVAALLAVHWLTWYRERMNALPRDFAGTAVSLGIVLLLLVAAVAVALLFRKRGSSGRRIVRGTAGLIVLAGVVQVVMARPVAEAERSVPRPETDRLRAADTGQRVVVFGFDGATWAVLDPLMEAGKLPNLAALVSRGRTFDLRTIRPTFSPVIWTSVATGKTRFHHSIHDVVQTRLPGGTRLPRSLRRTAFLTKTTGVFFRALNGRRLLRVEPYRSDHLDATSVFEAASEAGVRTNLVEWYVTWPARPLEGVTVSDRFHLPVYGGVPLTGLVLPEALEAPLAKFRLTPDEVPVETVRRFYDTTGLDEAGMSAWEEGHPEFVTELRHNIARDLTTRDVTVDLLARDTKWRLFGTYFRAVDLTHHLTWGLRTKEGTVDGDAALRLRPAIDRYHEFMDEVVGDVLAAVPEDAVVLMLSDHGYESRYAHSRAPDGFAILAGGATEPSAVRGTLDIYEVAPTVAALVGLPVAEDLEARPRMDLLSPDFAAEYSVRSVSTWERAGGAGGEVSADTRGAADAEVERLRALGYIQ